MVAPTAPAPVPSTSGQAEIHSASSARQAATSVAPEPVPLSNHQDTGMVDPPWPTTDRLMETSTDLPVPVFSISCGVNEETGLACSKNIENVTNLCGGSGAVLSTHAVSKRI